VILIRAALFRPVHLDAKAADSFHPLGMGAGLFASKVGHNAFGNPNIL
jgi:hypothetical protein